MASKKHAELIRAWLDGAEIQRANNPRHIGGEKWMDDRDPSWYHEHEYRIKPVEPAKQYPKTTMGYSELYKAFEPKMANGDWSSTVAENIANEALRHACDNGQVVTREEFDRAIGDRDKRDMAVAKAVLANIDAWLVQSYKRNFWPASIVGIDLAAIIAGMSR